jgi:eukaryotic-like serine/threonine-protein kinase
MSAVPPRPRWNQSGRTLEIVLASVAVVISVVALVVALTREPGAAKSAASTPSTLSSVRMPNVIGTRAGKARRLVTDLGLVATTTREPSATVPKGDVLAETPAAGTAVPRGTNANLVVSTGHP